MAHRCKHNCHWLGFFLLYIISTFVGYLKPKPSSLKNSCSSNHNWGGGVSLKVNVIAWLEFELTYFDATVQLFNHYATGSSSHGHTVSKKQNISYVVPSISFQTFLYRHLKLSWTLENSLCYCYTSYEMTDQFFMISGSNQQLQQQLEYTLLKPDCHSWGISKIQSDTFEERYAIKLCFKLGKNARETYGMLQTAFRPFCMNWAWVFEWHKRFKEGRESVRDDEI